MVGPSGRAPVSRLEGRLSGGSAPPPLPLFTVRDRVTGPDSPFSPTERLVALCLGDHMNLEGEAWPSLRTIASWTGLGMTSVRTAVDRLCDGEGRMFDRERGGARPGARYEVARYRLSNKPVTQRGAHEARASAGEREGIATRARAYRHATQKDPVKVPVKETNPPNPPASQGGTPRKGSTLNAACERVRAALVATGVKATRKVRKQIYEALKSGETEEQLLADIQADAEIRAGREADKAQQAQRVDAALAWIAAHGGAQLVARSAVEWARRNVRSGESMSSAIARWADDGVPRGVRALLREDLAAAEKRRSS